MKNLDTEEPLQLEAGSISVHAGQMQFDPKIDRKCCVTAVNNRACHMIISDGLHIWDLTQTAAHAVRLITVPWGVIRSPVNDPKSLVQFSVLWWM